MDTAVSPAVEVKPKRERQFGRVYNHDKGLVILSAAFNKDYKEEIDLSKIPTNVLQGFALQAVADYIVNEANDVLKDEKEGSEGERREKALAAVQEAYAELVEGKVDFRAGVGLGGMRSAIGSLGQALFELGKTYVVDQHGTKFEFNDVHSARAAVKSLYLSGKENEKKITGRMIFNAISADQAVKAKLAEIRKPKTSTKVDTAALMG